MMKLSILTLLILPLAAFAQQPDYQKLKTAAEGLYGEKSYAKAHELYKQAESIKLPSADARWLSSRAADTFCRETATTETADSTTFDQAREKLELLVRDIKRAEDQ